MKAILRSPLLSGVILGLTILSSPRAIHAQGTPLLEITTIQVAAPNLPVQFDFADVGTGATNYVVEFSTVLSGGAWSNITAAAITALGGGHYRVTVPAPLATSGFYRVRGTGGPGIVANFTSTAFQVTEGGSASLAITFSAPIFGIVRYTVSGTAAAGDYGALSGEVFVNGITATIPVTLMDNLGIGELKYLTLRLEPGPIAGYRLGAASQSTITIEENDADWQGSFVSDHATLGFVLRLLESGGGIQGLFRGTTAGFFPTNESPAAVDINPGVFSATVANISLPPGPPTFDLPANLLLQLNATNGVTNQSVSATLIQGAARLVTTIPAKPFLNRTNHGSFALLRPPSRPGTNEVELVNVP